MNYDIATRTLIWMINAETNKTERHRLRRQLLKVRYFRHSWPDTSIPNPHCAASRITKQNESMKEITNG